MEYDDGMRVRVSTTYNVLLESKSQLTPMQKPHLRAASRLGSSGISWLSSSSCSMKSLQIETLIRRRNG